MEPHKILTKSEPSRNELLYTSSLIRNPHEISSSSVLKSLISSIALKSYLPYSKLGIKSSLPPSSIAKEKTQKPQNWEIFSDPRQSLAEVAAGAPVNLLH